LFDSKLHQIIPKKCFVLGIVFNIVCIICPIVVSAFIVRVTQHWWILLILAMQTAMAVYYLLKIVKPLSKCILKLKEINK
jgi:hypothetical protein